MKALVRDVPKKRGRPQTTGRGAGIMVRVHAPMLKALDGWARGQKDKPSRPEAIRRLVEIGLSGAPKPPLAEPARQARRANAEKVAVKAVDEALATAPETVRAERRRKLTELPTELKRKG